MTSESAVDLAALQALLTTVVAPWVTELNLRVLAATPGEVTLALPIAPRHVHGGGVLCGQTMMGAADTAMILAIVSQTGAFKPMTTVQLQTSFLRPIPGKPAGNPAGNPDQPREEARVIARVLRLGKSLVFGEIEVQDPAGRLAAHATTTYALL
jgi:acyl-coenzyme A thioesterase PaaI-like protein